MKLTTERLKRLIREEIQKISEAVPRPYLQTGEVYYSQGKMSYFVFPKGQPSMYGVEGFAPESLGGHYRVDAKRDKTVPQGGLYLAIDALIRKKNPQDQNEYDYVVGIEDRELFDRLKASKDILPDVS